LRSWRRKSELERVSISQYALKDSTLAWDCCVKTTRSLPEINGEDNPECMFSFHARVCVNTHLQPGSFNNLLSVSTRIFIDVSQKQVVFYFKLVQFFHLKIPAPLSTLKTAFLLPPPDNSLPNSKLSIPPALVLHANLFRTKALCM